jgi:putative endonuclease
MEHLHNNEYTKWSALHRTIKTFEKRIYQHKNKSHPNTFSARYNLDKLVYFENHDIQDNARMREKQLKKWNRDWKIELIENTNPEWLDLYKNL